jgi:OmcA/MtrC family decaheme c-type cytochrome
VDGSQVAPHPTEVTQAQCNSCHFALSLHGTIRQNVQYCLLCHNPTQTDAARRPASQNPTQTIDLPVMIHRIHLGEEAQFAGSTGNVQLTPFIIYGFGNQPNDFSHVLFPGALNDCAKCHVNESQQVPPPATRIAVTNPRAYINPSPPTTAACTACHVTKAASAHASVNTSATLGESCAVCHGPGAEFSVDKVHAMTQ